MNKIGEIVVALTNLSNSLSAQKKVYEAQSVSRIVNDLNQLETQMGFTAKAINALNAQIASSESTNASLRESLKAEQQTNADLQSQVSKLTADRDAAISSLSTVQPQAQLLTQLKQKGMILDDDDVAALKKTLDAPDLAALQKTADPVTP